MNRFPLFVAVALVLGAVAICIVSYRQVIHEHSPAVIKTEQVCDCSDEFRDIKEDIFDASETAKGAVAYTTHFAIYANSLFQRIEKLETDWRVGSAQLRADIEKAKEHCKQNKPKCGGW